MSGNTNCTVYIGNLDERVSDRVLYDILIQAGRVIDLHIPRDKETDKPKGFAFAEYETEEIADYAVKLFSGLVSLFNRTLKFAVSPLLPPFFDFVWCWFFRLVDFRYLDKTKHSQVPVTGQDLILWVSIITIRRDSRHSWCLHLLPCLLITLKVSSLLSLLIDSWN